MDKYNINLDILANTLQKALLLSMLDMTKEQLSKIDWFTYKYT